MLVSTILLLAVALALDALAVAITTGMKLRRVTIGQTLRMAGVFGAFQFAMPVVGWFLGAGVQQYIEAWDHWLAFGLLAFIGLRMMKEARDNWNGEGMEGGVSSTDPTTGASVLLLGIATSIDALAVGLSMALLRQNIWFPAVVIGVVCFCLTAVGIHLGQALCNITNSWGNRAGFLGGLALIGIGVNILHEHGVFA